jgi:antitoxin CptB
VSLDRATRLRRLALRSGRRGLRELDLILGTFAEDLAALSEVELGAYERLLDCDDPELLAWVTGQAPPPPDHADLVDRIRATTFRVAQRFR